MPDYQKGKIYKIYSLNGTPEDVYYGSTVQTLAQRMSKHREQGKNSNKCKSSIIFDKFGIENCIIELVEYYPCNTVEELNAKEGYYHRNNPCVNKCVAGRTMKEWLEINKEKVKEKHKEYCKKNKDSILKQAKEYRKKNAKVISDKKKENYKVNKDAILEQRKENYKVNKDAISERRKEKIKCECGSEFRKNMKVRHDRSMKHQDYIFKLIQDPTTKESNDE